MSKISVMALALLYLIVFLFIYYIAELGLAAALAIPTTSLLVTLFVERRSS